MSPLDLAGFFVPLALLVILWKRRAHFRKHKISLVALLALTLVAIFHFDVGMLASDPYADFLQAVDAPRGTWRYSVFALTALAYWGDARTYLQKSTKPHLSDRASPAPPPDATL